MSLSSEVLASPHLRVPCPRVTFSDSRNQASPVAQPNEQNMQFLSDQQDDLQKSGTSLEEEADKLSRKLDLLAKDACCISLQIVDITLHTLSVS